MPEVELKFAIDALSRARLAECAALAGAKPRQRPMTSLYFDTPGGLLAARSMALRLRHAGGRWIPTLKGGRSGRGGLHARDEWEHPRADAVIDLSQFADTPLSRLPGVERLHRQLIPVFEVNVVRTAWIVTPPGAKLEVALDVGEVRARDGREAISEVEIEAVEGDPGAARAARAAVRAVRRRSRARAARRLGNAPRAHSAHRPGSVSRANTSQSRAAPSAEASSPSAPRHARERSRPITARKMRSVERMRRNATRAWCTNSASSDSSTPSSLA